MESFLICFPSRFDCDLLDVEAADLEENKTSLSADLTAARYSNGVRLEPPPLGNAVSAGVAGRARFGGAPLEETTAALLLMPTNEVDSAKKLPFSICHSLNAGMVEVG